MESCRFVVPRSLGGRLGSTLDVGNRLPRACGLGARARLVATLGGLRETSGPRIDGIPSTRPPWWRRQYRELKKIRFLTPSKCPIDLFGPVANGTILKRLHAAVAS